jgi:hypothetical protein
MRDATPASIAAQKAQGNTYWAMVMGDGNADQNQSAARTPKALMPGQSPAD